MFTQIILTTKVQEQSLNSINKQYVEAEHKCFHALKDILHEAVNLYMSRKYPVQCVSLLPACSSMFFIVLNLFFHPFLVKWFRALSISSAFISSLSCCIVYIFHIFPVCAYSLCKNSIRTAYYI